MYEKPQLLTKSHALHININQQYASKLCNDLNRAKFSASELEGTISFEDLNRDEGHEDVATIELSLQTDKLALRKFLRNWAV